jgi:hypothetical protein
MHASSRMLTTPHHVSSTALRSLWAQEPANGHALVTGGLQNSFPEIEGDDGLVVGQCYSTWIGGSASI